VKLGEKPSLDFTDRAAVREWLVKLRVYLDDVDALVVDMLRPPGERELGPALHRENYGAARERVADLLDDATPPPDGDPAELDADEPPWAPGSGA
jgi:hypothetical protein